MALRAEEKRTQGHLFAFIDLLFLVVAFFILVLFFVRDRQVEAVAAMEKVQEKLAAAGEEQTSFEATVTALTPMIEQFALRKNKEAERRQEFAARDLRKRRRTTFRLEYRIEQDGKILHKGRAYSLKGFRKGVVERLRKRHWIAFRAFAVPETPFGLVVKYRRAVLADSNEFDTYWDNLTKKKN